MRYQLRDKIRSMRVNARDRLRDHAFARKNSRQCDMAYARVHERMTVVVYRTMDAVLEKINRKESYVMDNG